MEWFEISLIFILCVLMTTVLWTRVNVRVARELERKHNAKEARGCIKFRRSVSMCLLVPQIKTATPRVFSLKLQWKYPFFIFFYHHTNWSLMKVLKAHVHNAGTEQYIPLPCRQGADCLHRGPSEPAFQASLFKWNGSIWPSHTEKHYLLFPFFLICSIIIRYTLSYV